MILSNLALGVLAVLALPAVPPQAQKTAPKPALPLVIAGVVKGPDGKSVENALIVARPESASLMVSGLPASARTDGTGGFRIEVARGNVFVMRILAKGFASRTIERVVPGKPISIVLARGSTVEGVVRDGDSKKPVAGARVEVTNSPVSVWNTDVLDTVTDARGRYRLEGVGPGVHVLSARARGYARTRRGSVAPGSRVDLFLFRGGSSIRGTVFDSASKPLAGALVHTEAEHSQTQAGLSHAPTTDGQGNFEVQGLQAGVYRIIVRHVQFAPTLLAGMTVEEGAETRCDVVMQPGSRLMGRLVDESAKPLSGHVTVEELGGQPAGPTIAELLRAEVGADGRFRLDSVPSGAHVLGLHAQGHASRRKDALVPPGRDVELGDILIEAGLSIQGRVEDANGQPLPYVRVAASQPSVFPPSTAETASEADGSFELSGLTPGAYRVVAQRAGYVDTEKRVEAGSGSVELVLRPIATVTGIVEDEMGQPLDTFRVVATSVVGGGLGSRWRANSGPGGRFVLEDLSEGRYVLAVTAPGRAPTTVSNVEVTVGGTTDVGTIRLDRGGTVRGVVVNSVGVPVVGATVVVRESGHAWGLSFLETSTDTSGAFELQGVGPGRPQVLATHPHYAEGCADVDVGLAGQPAEVRLTLLDGGRVEARMRASESARRGATRLDVTILRGAECSGTWERTVVGDPAGSLSMEHVVPGRGVATLRAASNRRLLDSHTRPIEVTEGQTTLVEFAHREILVAGRVTQSGNPMPYARVSLRTETIPESGVGSGAEATGITGEDGKYEVAVSEPGRYRAFVESLDRTRRLMTTIVDVTDADAHALDLRLPESFVDGAVVDEETGGPIAGARISVAMEPQGLGSASAISGADGKFQIRLDSGEYRVSAEAEGYQRRSSRVWIPPGGLTDLSLTLSRTTALTGRVIDADGRGVGGLRVMAWPVSGDPRVLPRFAKTLPDGSFRLQLGPLAHSLFVQADGRFAVVPEVSPGPEELVLTLRPGGRLVVRVDEADGAPVAGAWVRVGEGATTWLVERTNAKGTAELAVPSGSVTVNACKETLCARAVASVPEGSVTSVALSLRQGGENPAP